MLETSAGQLSITCSCSCSTNDELRLQLSQWETLGVQSRCWAVIFYMGPWISCLGTKILTHFFFRITQSLLSKVVVFFQVRIFKTNVSFASLLSKVSCHFWRFLLNSFPGKGFKHMRPSSACILYETVLIRFHLANEEKSWFWFLNFWNVTKPDIQFSQNYLIRIKNHFQFKQSLIEFNI